MSYDDDDDDDDVAKKVGDRTHLVEFHHHHHDLSCLVRQQVRTTQKHTHNTKTTMLKY